MSETFRQMRQRVRSPSAGGTGYEVDAVDGGGVLVRVAGNGDTVLPVEHARGLARRILEVVGDE